MPSGYSASFLNLDKKTSYLSQTTLRNFIKLLRDSKRIRKIDLEGKGYVDQATIINAVQRDGEGSNYDEIRATLRECNIDASGRVELEDYVEVRMLWIFR